MVPRWPAVHTRGMTSPADEEPDQEPPGSSGSPQASQTDDLVSQFADPELTDVQIRGNFDTEALADRIRSRFHDEGAKPAPQQPEGDS